MTLHLNPNHTNHVIITASSNLVDAIWTDQPPVPRRPVRVHPVKLAGVAVPEKLAAVRKLVVEARASSLVVMAMDEVHAAVAGVAVAVVVVFVVVLLVSCFSKLF